MKDLQNKIIKKIPFKRRKLCIVLDITDFNDDVIDENSVDLSCCSILFTIVSLAFCLCNSVE